MLAVSIQCLKACIHSNALSSSLRYFGLVQEVRRWFDQFAIVAEVDLEDFDQLSGTADPGRLVKRFRVSWRCTVT